MRSILFTLLPVLAACSPYAASFNSVDSAPLVSTADAVEIPDSYIVVFKKHVTPAKAQFHHSWVQQLHDVNEDQRTELRKRSIFSDAYEGLKQTYNIGDSFKAYAGHFDEDVIEQVRRHPDVEFVEKNKIVHALDSGKVETSAPWGLARISHCKTLGFGTYNRYIYSEDGGEGVDAYIIDTGTNIQHVDFEGRAAWGKTIPSGDEDLDGNGHGTHCSGTVAGKKYGVAKKASIIAVKVLRSNGSGTMNDVISGVEYAATAHLKRLADAKKGKAKGFKGSVANMSLGGGKSPGLDRAVNAAVEAGIHFAVAAGNDNADACNYSPAAAENPVTVGASTFYDERAYFSNYGKCTDIFAPGLNIESTWIGSKYATNTISGTSMASPHIAGLLAYYLSLQPAKDSGYAIADITPKELKSHIVKIASKGKLSDIPRDTPNLLAWNGGGSSNFTDIIQHGPCGDKSSEDVPSKSIEDVRDAVLAEAEKLIDLMSEVEAKITKQLEKSASSLKLQAGEYDVVRKVGL